MSRLDQILEKIESFYFDPHLQFIELTGRDKSTHPPITKKCRIGYHQIDAFMLNTKRYALQRNFYWYIDYTDFHILPESLKENIWVLCLLSYSYLNIGIINHPVTLQAQDDLILLACEYLKSGHSGYAIRTLQHAKKLGSDEAGNRLKSKYYDDYTEDDMIPMEHQKMDVS